VNAKTIPVNTQKTETEGKCLYTMKRLTPEFEGKLDIFTQYVAPYGGQGPNNPSDAFAPQGQVKLYGSVTYRGEPVQGKPVTYQIAGPPDFASSAVNFTDEDGLSLIEFTIPWEGVDFGLWDVSASVDIAGNVVSDTLMFRVGWLIEVRDVTINGTDIGTKEVGGKVYPQLYKGSTYELSASLKVITMQDPTACLQLQGIAPPKMVIVYTGVDELRQPIFTKYIELPIGPMSTTDPTPEQMKAFVLNADGRTKSNGKMSIYIPKTAFTGVAAIRANVLTAYPSGVAYNNPETGKKEVWIARKQ